MFHSVIKAWNELVGNTEQEEAQGILLMLIWVMRVDGKLALNQFDQINDFGATLDWDDPHQARQYIAYCIDRVKDLEAGRVGQRDLLDEIHRLLSSIENRAKAIMLCREVAIADGYYDVSEKSLIKLFESEFA